MGYGFGTTAAEHRLQLVEALHAARWSEEMPEHVNGLSVNLLLETAVDQLIEDGDEEFRLLRECRLARSGPSPARPGT